PINIFIFFFFFFSSRRRHTRWPRDWSQTCALPICLELLKWVFQARSLEKFEATPLVVDGIMYTVQAPNDVVALDPVTGRVFWTRSEERRVGKECRSRWARYR